MRMYTLTKLKSIIVYFYNKIINEMNKTYCWKCVVMLASVLGMVRCLWLKNIYKYTVKVAVLFATFFILTTWRMYNIIIGSLLISFCMP